MKEPEIILSPGVELELGAIWARIATDNPDEATRVIELARETFNILARKPGCGRLRKFRGSRLTGIRSWHISGVDNYLVFYHLIPNGIQVLHVCHGAREVEALFGEKDYSLKIENVLLPTAPTESPKNYFKFLPPVVRQMP
ncbi:MAG: type II toxin-antitoxin system RelE/ParE family toxin [Verrucomicrobiota bacterium]